MRELRVWEQLISSHLVEVGVVRPTVLREEADPVARKKSAVWIANGILRACVPQSYGEKKVRQWLQPNVTIVSEGGRRLQM